MWRFTNERSLMRKEVAALTKVGRMMFGMELGSMLLGLVGL